MEAVATAGVEVLVQKLINVLNEEYSLLRGLDGEARKLQKTLVTIQAYLNDAQKKSITQDAVMIWLRELEDLAFEADNVLDELNYHRLRQKINKMETPNPKAKDKVLSCFTNFPHHLPRRSKMAHAIKQINANFESVNNKATQLGLQSMIVNAPDVTPVFFETDSVSVDPIFIGRDDDVPKLVHMLTHTQPQEKEMTLTFSILALVGMGGMGKTTLTKKVFNHERVKSRFGSLFWVHVSQKFYPIDIFKKIHYKLTKMASDGYESKDCILKKLQKDLEAKTYLLVLDDVWNEDVLEWEGFMNSMSGVTSTMGNGIIITTRSQKVASIVKPFHIHSLNGLSDDDCWYIIKEKSFDGNGEVPLECEMIGKEIAKKCQGLPLAANVIGGVLRYKSAEEWRLINEKGLSNGEGGENIKKILKLSYDYLASPSLKKCFAYCSIFPKGQKIVKQQLIELWMGEEFLQLNQGDDMESVSNMFFNVLLQNSLLQVAERYFSGDVKSYVMHDLVHDLASSILSNRTPIRYMFLKQGSRPIPKEVAKYLRTLIFEGDPSHTMFSNFKSLHNLTLASDYCRELPNSIGQLIHLRNLNISDTSIENLPEWIGELHHLQTVRRGRCLVNLPSTLKRLINLRHIYMSFHRDAEWPVEIGRLTSLQTIPKFSVGKEKGYRIEELGSLKNLRESIEIQHLERVCDKKEAMKANMLEKPNLYELVLQWDEVNFSERNDESVLEGLRPHANLKKLTVEGYKGKRFPTWLMDEPQGCCLHLHNLIEINLYNCSECEEITLGHLPNLRSLSIRGLESLKSLSERFFYNHHNLSDLYISECDMLGALPDGLDTLKSLHSFSITNCENLKLIGKPSCGEGEYQGILRQLSITGCRELMEFPCQMLESWAHTIEVLHLAGLRSLMNLQMLIDCLAKSSHLIDLRIIGIPKLMSAGSVESWDLGSLRNLNVDVSVEWSEENSVAINDTMNGILEGCCNSLERLTLRGVENWERLPQSIQHLAYLSFLELENIEMEELPQWFGNLSALETLHLYGCKKLRCLPSVDALKPLIKLKMLFIKGCPELCIDSERRNHTNLRIYKL